MHNIPHTKKAKQKISQSKLGKYPTINTRKKLSQAQIKRFKNPLERKKISRSLKGRKFSKETLLKISNARKGMKNYNSLPVGTITVLKRGYKLIKLSVNKWIFEHVYKVEKFIGRKLRKNEVIHHIDGNKNNNKLFNLFLCRKKGLHVCIETLINHGVINRFYIKSNLKQFRKLKV